jgi:hypothetical protein
MILLTTHLAVVTKVNLFNSITSRQSMNYYIFSLTTANVCVTDVIQNERGFANEAKTERTVTQRRSHSLTPKRDDINKNNDDDASSNTYIG